MAKLFLEDTAIGRMGSVIQTGATAVTGNFYAVQFITDCTPTVFTVADGVGTYTGVAYSAGTVVYGDITAITVAAGETFIAYKK
jgi:RecJ-like exonuclease